MSEHVVLRGKAVNPPTPSQAWYGRLDAKGNKVRGTMRGPGRAELRRQSAGRGAPGLRADQRARIAVLRRTNGGVADAKRHARLLARLDASAAALPALMAARRARKLLRKLERVA